MQRPAGDEPPPYRTANGNVAAAQVRGYRTANGNVAAAQVRGYRTANGNGGAAQVRALQDGERQRRRTNG